MGETAVSKHTAVLSIIELKCVVCEIIRMAKPGLFLMHPIINTARILLTHIAIVTSS